MQDRHGGDHTWEITGVEGRDHILFHTANFADDLFGCVGVGGGVIANLEGVTASRDASERFYGSTSGVKEGTVEIRSGALEETWSMN